MMIGILGGGQLGRMLALAGYPLGMSCRFLDPSPVACAASLGDLFVGDYEDYELVRGFASGVDIVTYEFENVPVATAEALATTHPVFPPPQALSVAQDRLIEKQFFQQLNILTPAFLPITSRADLDTALAQIGLPAVVKTRRFGYDGKGQYVLHTPSECEHVWEQLGRVPLIFEQFVPFERELSLLSVRSHTGETAFYPLIENEHRMGILHCSIAPAPQQTPQLQAMAESYGRRLLDAMNYVGVLALELFQVNPEHCQGTTLLANEMAPRVHNSGHWTIEGAETSQFSNHLRAIAGLPLGSTNPLGPCAMVNIIGSAPDPSVLLAIAGAQLHLYQKAPRPGRKLGHVTLRAPDMATIQRRIALVRSVLSYG